MLYDGRTRFYRLNNLWLSKLGSITFMRTSLEVDLFLLIALVSLHRYPMEFAFFDCSLTIIAVVWKFIVISLSLDPRCRFVWSFFLSWFACSLWMGFARPDIRPFQFRILKRVKACDALWLQPLWSIWPPMRMRWCQKRRTSTGQHGTAEAYPRPGHFSIPRYWRPLLIRWHRERDLAAGPIFH